MFPRFKYCLLSLSTLCLHNAAWAQQVTAPRQLQEVVVSGYSQEPADQSTLNIRSINVDSARRYGSLNLSDVLAKEPGVSLLSTGPAISKPVVRGLYGNRVLVLLNGLRFDNQQWQEEHGLGISTMGISKVELIKGPLGILYGTEAMGGVINIMEAQKPSDTQLHADLLSTLHSNTRGAELEAGIAKAKEHSWWRMRAGAANHADYSDGKNQRVLNSRFDNYAIKAGFGWERKRWTSINNYAASFSRFGFIFNDVYTFIQPDERWSRKLNTNPAHLVFLNLLSSQNTFELKNGDKLQLNASLQSNKRMENEGGGTISLNMHLLTAQYLLRLEHRLNKRNKLVCSHLYSFESNTNYGARKIVPDARMHEANIAAFLETTINSLLKWENGAGLGIKSIQTFFTPGANGQGKEIQAFQKTAPYYNAYSGLNFSDKQHWQWKLNAATGLRVGNLAELASDGLHEGVFTYEIGNPQLKTEQLLSINLQVNFSSELLEVFVSPFYNRFQNYIYLSPTNEQWYGFPVYRYRQQAATQFGTEAGCTVKPTGHIRWQWTYSGMRAKSADGNYLPYTPAQKISSTLQYQNKLMQQHPLAIFVQWEYNAAQKALAPYEIGTGSYPLWHLGGNIQLPIRKKQVDCSFSCSNLFNIAYYDHLSRFKNFGLLNRGRNVSISIHYQF